MNEFLIVKAAKALIQSFEKYRNSLIFKAYLNIDNFHVFIEGSSRAEKNLDILFSEQRFTISKKNSTYFSSENFFKKKFFKIVSKQQNNAIVQFVSSIFLVALVVIPISTEKVLRYVIKKNSELLPFQKNFEVSFKLINKLQHHVKKINSFIVRTSSHLTAKTETTFDFNFSFDRRFFLKKFSFLKKSISTKQIFVRSKSFDKKSMTEIFQKKISQKILSRLIVKKINFASLTSRKFVLLFRIFFIREKTKNFLIQFFFSANFFEFRYLDSHTVFSFFFFSLIRFILSSKFFLFCIFLTNRFHFHYFFLFIFFNNFVIQTDFFFVNDFLSSDSSKIVKFIEFDFLSRDQHQKKVSN